MTKPLPGELPEIDEIGVILDKQSSKLDKNRSNDEVKKSASVLALYIYSLTGWMGMAVPGIGGAILFVVWLVFLVYTLSHR